MLLCSLAHYHLLDCIKNETCAKGQRLTRVNFRNVLYVENLASTTQAVKQSMEIVLELYLADLHSSDSFCGVIQNLRCIILSKDSGKTGSRHTKRNSCNSAQPTEYSDAELTNLFEGVYAESG